MERILDIFFRRPLLFLLLIAIPPVIGVATAYTFVPRTYQSVANLWALRRYEIIGATGPESNLEATPADTQSTALNELLQTREFSLTVADDAQILPTLHLSSSILANSEQRDDALVAEISKHVLATSLGYNLFQITYANHDPYVAQKVVQAVVANFGIESQGFSVAEGQRLLQSYQGQLPTVKATADNAAAAEAHYIASHPNLNANALAADPQYGQLHNQTLQAQTALNNLQSAITTVQQEIASEGLGADSLYRVQDQPTLPYTPASRSKQYLLGGGIGLGLALLIGALYILILIRRDNTVHTALDLTKVTGYPVLMQFPRLPSGAVPVLMKSSIQDTV
ncbi:MAG TPA: hypothetical protein VJ761_25450 [Ktedonobacteraceae bacterium]|nr:hypothetical protein [Ktedonobacteraceae bacterium]